MVESLTRPWSSLSCFEATPSIQVSKYCALDNVTVFPTLSGFLPLLEILRTARFSPLVFTSCCSVKCLLKLGCLLAHYEVGVRIVVVVVLFQCLKCLTRPSSPTCLIQDAATPRILSTSTLSKDRKTLTDLGSGRHINLDTTNILTLFLIANLNQF